MDNLGLQIRTAVFEEQRKDEREEELRGEGRRGRVDATEP